WFVRSCTFKANADVLDFEFQGGDVAQHVAVYDFDGFQLEEGTVATDYVEYQTIENTPPVFGGESTLILGYDAPVSAQTLVDNHITATDEIDGDISDAIIIAKDEYGPNNQVKGTYPIDLYVEDSSGNEATYTLNVKVVDTLAPIIDSVDALSVNVNSPTTVDAIIGEHATLSDEYDGVIDAYTITSDTYTGNETVLGTSNLTFEIADASGNTKEHSITITTEDSEAPQINGQDTQTINQSSMKTLEELFAQYSVSDNHTASEAIAFEIASDTFPSEGESGEYTMTLKATDESGNETLKTVTILIEDDIEPTLRSHSYKKESYKDTFDIETYISKMTVDDNDSILSTNDVVVLENEYQSGTVGKYEILFEVSDDAGNDTSHKLTVDVVDDVAPVFAFSETIQTTTTTVLNETQLNQLIVESEDMETFDAHNYRVLNNTYTDNAAKEGTYTYTVEYMNQKGDTVTSSIDIEVLKINAPEEASNTSYLPWLLLPGTVITVATLTIIKKRK
ncbi:MAG: Ig-like domain repeat protein, partial [Bacillota bacterium]